MAFEQRPSMEVASLAARVPHENSGLYVLGPFADRVSFASQQRRAISLVCAIDADLKLHGDDDGLKKKRACIVGAGLAGLTASVALAAFGCASFIVERGYSALDVALKASHRAVHPTINFWPRDRLNMTTELPFLNWYQDECNLVAERILEQWRSFAAKHGQIREITYGCEVTGFEPVGDKWELKYSGNAPDINEFDIVILAMGFGAEKPLPGSDTPGYWDQSEDIVNEVRRYVPPAIKNYVVVGTGDGGLIETLRLLYRNFTAGKIVSGTEQELSQEIIQQQIKKVEADVRAEISDAILRGTPALNDLKDRLCQQVWDVYATLPPDLGKGFRDAVEKDRTKIAKVLLVGERPTPMDYSASPYHRLLIVHAISMGWIDYLQVAGRNAVSVADCVSHPKVGLGGKYTKLKELTLTVKRRISGKDRKLIATDVGNQIVLKQALLLHRFGPESIVEPMLNKLDCTGGLARDVRQRQLLYAEQDWISFSQICFLAEQLGLKPPSKKKDWIFQHLKEAERFFADRFDLEVQVSKDPENPAIILRPANDDDPRHADINRAGPVPNHFYGIDLVGNYVSVTTMTESGH